VSRIVTRGQCAFPSFAARGPSVCVASRCGADLIERPPVAGTTRPLPVPTGSSLEHKIRISCSLVIRELPN